MNDLLSSGNIPGLFPAEDMDDIINNVRPIVKRAGIPDTRDNCWDMFISECRAACIPTLPPSLLPIQSRCFVVGHDPREPLPCG